MAYNQPHLVMPIRNFNPNPCLMYFGSSSIMVHNQHIWPHWTRTHKLQTYSNHKGLAKFTIWFHNYILHVSFDITPLHSNGSSICKAVHPEQLYHTTQMMSLSSCQALLWILTLVINSSSPQHNKSYN